MRRISKWTLGGDAALSGRFVAVYAVAALAIVLTVVSIGFRPSVSDEGVEISDRRYEPEDIFISVEPVGLTIKSGEEMKPFTLEMIDQVLEQRMIPSPSHVGVMVWWRKGVSYSRVFEILEELKRIGFTRIRLDAET